MRSLAAMDASVYRAVTGCAKEALCVLSLVRRLGFARQIQIMSFVLDVRCGTIALLSPSRHIEI